jgi:hypothetical protein
MTAFKNDRPQFQSFTGSYQAFEQPPAKSIKWWLLVQKEKKPKRYLFDMCIYNVSYVCTDFERGDYYMAAFKNNTPPYQSFTGSCQAFG